MSGQRLVLLIAIVFLVGALFMKGCQHNQEMEVRRYDICAKSGGYILDARGQCVIGPPPPKL